MPTDEDCKICLTEATKTLNQLENLTRDSIKKMNSEHEQYLENRQKTDDKQSSQFFEAQTLKHDNFLEKQDRRENIKLGINLAYLTIFVSFLIYANNRMEDIDTQLRSKANTSEVLKRTEAEMLIEQGDAYNRALFIRNLCTKGDTITYTANKKLIFKNGLRSGEKFH
jgi:hypothetical protein